MGAGAVLRSRYGPPVEPRPEKEKPPRWSAARLSMKKKNKGVLIFLNGNSWDRGAGNGYNRPDIGGTEKRVTPEGGVSVFFRKGRYKLADLAICENIVTKPPCVEISIEGWSSWKPGSCLKLPFGFNGQVPTAISTPISLGFYGCRFADGSAVPHRLSVDSQYSDFVYSNYKRDWVLNPKCGVGALGIEYHEFIHLECPMSSDSGHFLIGKMKEHEYEDQVVLCLTAFKIPVNSTVYIAPNVLHSNDRLEGLWHTFLPSFHEEDVRRGSCDVHHTLLKQPDVDGAGWVNVDLKFSEVPAVAENWRESKISVQPRGHHAGTLRQISDEDLKIYDLSEVIPGTVHT